MCETQGINAVSYTHLSNDAAKETSFNEMFQQNPNVKLAAFDAVNDQPVDLTQAAENSLHAVVHITVSYTHLFAMSCYDLRLF